MFLNSCWVILESMKTLYLALLHRVTKQEPIIWADTS